MSEKGSLIIQVYTARMVIPIEGASVTITTDDGEIPKLIGYRETDVNGKTEPIEIETPNVENSQDPSDKRSFATCNVDIYHENYYRTFVEHVQVFSGLESIQPMEMVPREEYQTNGNGSFTFNITAQNL